VFFWVCVFFFEFSSCAFCMRSCLTSYVRRVLVCLLVVCVVLHLCVSCCICEGVLCGGILLLTFSFSVALCGSLCFSRFSRSVSPELTYAATPSPQFTSLGTANGYFSAWACFFFAAWYLRDAYYAFRGIDPNATPAEQQQYQQESAPLAAEQSYEKVGDDGYGAAEYTVEAHP
jgi:hypothetical protein